ncbi:MAG: right-handed parallel beta-helix repeat-containing protein [Anaerolineae bacterium]|nr:right-handed parallel beta-helix repeat-containing protein [Anaerolineae bacterium]
MRTKQLIICLALGLGALLALLAGLHTAQAAPAGNPLFVKPAGGGDCSQGDPCALQTALGLAADGDTIYAAGGVYTGTGAAVITVTKFITLAGGWDGAPGSAAVCDPGIHRTILDGENARRAVYITGTIAPVLDGLTLQRGNAAGLGGDPSMPTTDFGGALYANNASPVITSCRVASSTAGFGGGLALYYGSPTVGNSAIVSNTASQDIGGGVIRGGGGGIFLYHSPATVAGNLVTNNVAGGTYSLPFDGGGGIYLDTSAAAILNNTIQGNQAFGPYARGGGLYIWQSGAVIRGNVIRDNSAPISFGGGVGMAMSPVDFDANTVLNNHAMIGGGLEIACCDPFTMTNNVIALNRAGGYGAALFAAGCIWPGSYTSQGTLLHNTFADNQNMSVDPWVIGVGAPGGPMATMVFTNTIIDIPAGIFVDTAGTAILDTTLWDPTLLLLPGLTISGTGTIISGTNYYSAPLLIRPTFRLASGSPAIDQGTDAGVKVDIDGDPRPIGALPDIGADEARRWTFLPLVLRNY